MTKAILAVSVVLSLTLSASAQDTLDSLTKDMLKHLGKTVDILETIKDKKSAMEATPRLRDVAKTLAELKKKAEKLKPSSEEQEALERKYQKQVTAVVSRMLTETVRLQKVEGAAEALKELDRLK